MCPLQSLELRMIIDRQVGEQFKTFAGEANWMVVNAGQSPDEVYADVLNGACFLSSLHQYYSQNFIATVSHDSKLKKVKTYRYLRSEGARAVV